MTNRQYQILDELYFVVSFAGLAQATGLPEATLQQELRTLRENGWIKVLYPNPDTEYTSLQNQPEPDLAACYYLATKAGLLAHNAR